MTLDVILEEIKKAETIVILTHEGPDGDAIGSSLGLYFALQTIGKNADVIIPEYSKSFRFMPGVNMIKESSSIEHYDLAISLDCADSKILKGYTKYFENAKMKIVIDHHGSNTMYGDINFINPAAPACAEILVEMFNYFGIELNKEIATSIMTGIITDTGGFCYNATAETFEFAADITRLGVNISEIFRKTLYTKNRASFELNKIARERMQFLENGKVTFTYITNEDQEKAGAVQGDHEGIVEIGKYIEDVEVSIFLHETKEKGFKISLRSLEYVDVAKIAIMLGGGGHYKAAGAYMRGTPEEIRNKVLQEVRKQLV